MCNIDSGEAELREAERRSPQRGFFGILIHNHHQMGFSVAKKEKPKMLVGYDWLNLGIQTYISKLTNHIPFDGAEWC